MALPQDIAALNAMIQQAVDAAVAAIPAPQAGGAAAGAAAPFHVNPAGVGNDPWDFQSSQGIRLYQAATAPFEPLYDGDPAKLNTFLRHIRNRAEAYGFSRILTVADSQGVPRDLTREYGCLVTANVKAAATLYLRLEQRSHQASVVLRMLVLNSAQPRIIDRLFHRKADYSVDIALPGAQANVKEDGPSMVLALINMVMVENRSSVSNIMRKVYALPKLMEDSKSNIEEFNTAVEGLVDSLIARDAPVPDLMDHLFSGYKTCDDQNFVDYISRKEDSYADNTIITMTYTELMQTALEKYKSLVERDQWGKKTEQQLEFIALKSELKLLKQNPKKANQAARPATGAAAGTAATTARTSNRNTGSFAWKNIAPKANEAKEKTVEGKDYVYCPYHGNTKWVLKINVQGVDHRTGCRMMLAANAQGAQAAGANADRMVAALANVTEDEGEEENI
jgi:hypothetical protein